MMDENGNFWFSTLFTVVSIFATLAGIGIGVVAISGNLVDRDYYKDENLKIERDKEGNIISPLNDTLDNGKEFFYEVTKNSDNPNKYELKIYNSSTYSASELSEMLDKIMEKNDGEYMSLINKKKVLNELKWHNAAYNVKYKTKSTVTADVYFNSDDVDHAFFSWIMNNIYI